MLQSFFSLDRSTDALVVFCVDQAPKTIPAGESWAPPGAVLPGPAREVAGHAHVQRTSWLIGHDVHPSAQVVH